MDPMAPAAPSSGAPAGDQKMVSRTAPDPNPERKALVDKLLAEVRLDKEHWEKHAFRQMREDMDFAAGLQWSTSPEDDRYTANIVQRHVQVRTAALYAKNPKAVAKRRRRLMATTWDETMESVLAAASKLASLAQNPEAAADPNVAGEIQAAMALLQDAQRVDQEKTLLDKFAETLEIVYEYNVSEQAVPFKSMMKLLVRRAVTSGVGWVRPDFQRIMEPRPGAVAQIEDATQRLATLQRLSEDLADGEIAEGKHGEEIERLKLMLAAMQQERDIVVREGLVFDFPASDAVIPHRRCTQLREFLGCDWVTQEYLLTPEKVREIYGVDITPSFTRYRLDGATGAFRTEGDTSASDEGTGCDGAVAVVWEMFSRNDGLVYVMCDGYTDFLREPAPPPVWSERFFPWRALVLNEIVHPTKIYPPSDVRLLRDAQMEYNRLREGLREHRKANRPGSAAASGVLSEKDAATLQSRPANAIVELDGLQPGQKVEDVLSPLRGPGLDPNLYEINGVFEDVQRVVGSSEANFGGVSGSTATETSLAEASRMGSNQSAVDELDDLLSELARDGGKILLAELPEETVKEIVGPGAVWPTLDRAKIAKEIWLEVEAGSSGRPNQAAEIANFERMAPILMQIPGVQPAGLARVGLRRLDDRLDLTELYDKSLLSIAAMNQQAGMPAGGAQQNAGPNAPAAQGAEGAGNAPQPGAVAGNPGGAPSAFMPGGAMPQGPGF